MIAQKTMVKTEKHFQRFTRLERILHILMIISFMSLALTGMTLKFSYTGWAVVMSHFFGGFESAGDEFKAQLFVTGMTKTMVGREPPSPEATPLPPLKT